MINNIRYIYIYVYLYDDSIYVMILYWDSISAWPRLPRSADVIAFNAALKALATRWRQAWLKIDASISGGDKIIMVNGAPISGF